jgi:hypothetical protein
MKLTQLTESLGLMCYINDDLLTFTRAAGNRKDQIEMFLWMMEGLIEFEEKKTVDDWFALEDEVEHVNDGMTEKTKVKVAKRNLMIESFHLMRKSKMKAGRYMSIKGTHMEFSEYYQERKSIDRFIIVFRDGVENADKLIAGKLYLNLAKKYFELIQKK